MTTQQTATVPVVDNRDATADDAKALARIFVRMHKAVKAFKKATREAKDIWLCLDDRDSLREARNMAQMRLDDVMDESWTGLNELPSGVCAPNGATPQTVALEFFNAGLNRNLKARMTSSEAKKINAASFRL